MEERGRKRAGERGLLTDSEIGREKEMEREGEREREGGRNKVSTRKGTKR